MPPTNPSVVVDAIMSDLLTGAGFNPAPKTTRLYVEPVAVTPDKTPYLALWTEETEFALLVANASGVAYERRHDFVCAWYAYNVAGAETGGTGDSAIVQALEVVREQLVARIAGYANGVPGFGSQLVATITRSRITAQQGDLWTAHVEFAVEEAA